MVSGSRVRFTGEEDSAETKWPRRLVDLLGQTVWLDGGSVGHIDDVLMTRAGSRVLGLAVRRHGGQSSFLPRAAAGLRDDGAHPISALVLLAGNELRYYVDSGLSLKALLADRVAGSHQLAMWENGAVGPP